jgi:hypothetical protein
MSNEPEREPERWLWTDEDIEVVKAGDGKDETEDEKKKKATEVAMWIAALRQLGIIR